MDHPKTQINHPKESGENSFALTQGKITIKPGKTGYGFRALICGKSSSTRKTAIKAIKAMVIERN